MRRAYTKFKEVEMKTQLKKADPLSAADIRSEHKERASTHVFPSQAPERSLTQRAEPFSARAGPKAETSHVKYAREIKAEKHTNEKESGRVTARPLRLCRHRGRNCERGESRLKRNNLFLGNGSP